MSQQSKDQYVELLAKELTTYYNMTMDKAMEIVKNSSISKMLVDDDDAQWQMHQPLDSTVDEIFCEYKELVKTNV